MSEQPRVSEQIGILIELVINKLDDQNQVVKKPKENKYKY